MTCSKPRAKQNLETTNMQWMMCRNKILKCKWSSKCRCYCVFIEVHLSSHVGTMFKKLINQLTETWLDVHYELVRLLSPSGLEVKRGHRAKTTSLDHLRICSRPVTDEDHVCKLAGGPRGPKLWHTFDVPRAETATRLPSITAWGHHRALRHDYQASLRFAVLGNYTT